MMNTLGLNPQRHQLRLAVRHALAHSLDPTRPAGITHYHQQVEAFADALENFIDYKIAEAMKQPSRWEYT